tara:strand:+ start:197 stop:388 length:192 start_codon:yes stop_codon:yes gene_type:complete
MKICSNPECHLKGELQPLDSFHKNAITKDGRVAKCKKCLLEKDRKNRRIKDKWKMDFYKIWIG